ncbi:hypothetical protein [cyanobacterium endosymbiont of Rhopalodia gibberula]|nr:hypothetical protein [cyanobacterium endosymbiont of Rhopalodia gibberula]
MVKLPSPLVSLLTIFMTMTFISPVNKPIPIEQLIFLIDRYFLHQ